MDDQDNHCTTDSLKTVVVFNVYVSLQPVPREKPWYSGVTAEQTAKIISMGLIGTRQLYNRHRQ